MGFIYKLEFSNGKCYVGQTKQTIKKRFANHSINSRTSDQLVYRAWRKHGTPIVVIIGEYPNDDLSKWESFHVAQEQSFGSGGYNSTSGGENYIISEEVSAKRSASLKIARGTPEAREKMSLLHKGRKNSAEHIEKTAAFNRGRKLTPEHIAKLSESHKGNKHTEETKKKMSESGKNKIFTAEHRMKISEARKGTNLSAEHIEKLSAAAKAYWDKLREEKLAAFNEKQGVLL